MNAHATAADRIAALVARLGSAADGERPACLRQLDRLLERHGLGWNDLGAALTAAPVRIVYAHRKAEPDPAADDWCGMANFCSTRSELLAPNEADFIATMARVLRRPGNQPTPEQANWLGGNFDRLQGDHGG